MIRLLLDDDAYRARLGRNARNERGALSLAPAVGRLLTAYRA